MITDNMDSYAELSKLLYPWHLCHWVHSFRLSVRMFVSSFVRTSVTSVRGICVKVLR